MYRSRLSLERLPVTLHRGRKVKSMMSIRRPCSGLVGNMGLLTFTSSRDIQSRTSQKFAVSAAILELEVFVLDLDCMRD